MAGRQAAGIAGSRIWIGIGKWGKTHSRIVSPSGAEREPWVRRGTRGNETRKFQDERGDEITFAFSKLLLPKGTLLGSLPGGSRREIPLCRRVPVPSDSRSSWRTARSFLGAEVDGMATTGLREKSPRTVFQRMVSK